MIDKYLQPINDEKKEYFKILSKSIPSWFLEYVNTPEMLRLAEISQACGTDYSNLFNIKYWDSVLNHSVGVALIVWHFTKDKKQTLAGLFHDISTPVFKHCIDFMNGDSQKQESTEELTEYIIRNSQEIMALLQRDGISVEEVMDYHIYPIADNDTPKLSADRCEYNFSSGLTFHRVWELDEIKEVYDDLIVLKNEDNEDEIGFQNVNIAEKYIQTVSNLWPEWISDKDRTVMQFLADIVKSMSIKGYISVEDLYTKTEKDVLKQIEDCPDKYITESFKKFRSATRIYSSNEFVDNKYCTSVVSKRRYINPLVQTDNGNRRISDVSNIASEEINKYFNIQQSKWTGFDFEFTPYQN